MIVKLYGTSKFTPSLSETVKEEGPVSDTVGDNERIHVVGFNVADHRGGVVKRQVIVFNSGSNVAGRA